MPTAHNGLKIESKAQKNGSVIFGYAAVFNSPSQPIDGAFIEIIQPKAFADALKRSDLDVRALYNHSSDHIDLLGRSTSGSLRLYEDDFGLKFYCDVLDDFLSQSILAKIARRDITGASFSFTVDKDIWRLEKGKFETRYIVKVGELIDIAPCTYPAYLGTSVEVLQNRAANNNTDNSYDTKKVAEALLQEIADDEFEYFLQTEREKKARIMHGYNLAGRILNRVRQQLNN
jgi:HK97 family phage prohead protease